MWILTLRLLGCENQNSDLDGVRLTNGVCDRQLELVHPRRQIRHHDLVIVVCFLQSEREKPTISDGNVQISP